MSASKNASFSSDPTQRQVSTALSCPPPIQDIVADDVMAPYRHVASLESKKFRGTLVDAFNAWLLLPEEATDEVKSVVEMLHNASLIIDDIEDSSNMRRGAPAAHRVFGMPLALNCANMVYFVALERLMQVPRVISSRLKEKSGGTGGDDDTTTARRETAARLSEYYAGCEGAMTRQLCEAFTTEMIQLHHGQGLDIYWRDMAQCPSLEEYDQMVLKKTGGLLRLAVKLMVILSPLKSDASSIGNTSRHAATPRDAVLEHQLIALVDHIGVFFQTLDDYLNVCSDQYHKNKSYCEDLTEGKFSFPIIHCLQQQSAKGDKTLLHILRQHPTDVEVKRYCVDMMRQAGSLQTCQNRIEELRAMIVAHVNRLGSGELLLRCIDDLCKLM